MAFTGNPNSFTARAGELYYVTVNGTITVTGYGGKTATTGRIGYLIVAINAVRQFISTGIEPDQTSQLNALGGPAAQYAANWSVPAWNLFGQ